MALDGRVLLLNQTYEPLGTVSVARAVIMSIKGTVTVEELYGDRVLHSARTEFPVPSVIRRRSYINVRQRREASGMRRTRIYMRDKFRCQYCGEKKAASELTLDHILPRSRGGDNSPVNIVTACVPCNNRKGSRLADEAGMFPSHSPHEPNYVELVWAVRRITPLQAEYIKMFYGADVLRALQHHPNEAHATA